MDQLDLQEERQQNNWHDLWVILRHLSTFIERSVLTLRWILLFIAVDSVALLWWLWRHW